MSERHNLVSAELEPLTTTTFALRGGIHWVIACSYIVRVTTGSGLLALPKAADESGFTCLALLFVFLALSIYTARVLSKCWLFAWDRCTTPAQREHLRRRPYSAIAEIAFSDIQSVSSYARHLVSFFINLTMFGSAVVYLLLSAQSVSKLASENFKPLCFCDYILILGGVATVVVICYRYPSDKWFWALNFISVGTTLVASVLLCYEIIKESKEIDTYPVETHSEVTFQSFFTSIGTLCFAWGGHVAFPSFQTEMEKPHHFGRSLYVGFAVITLMYIPSTYLAFFVYGDHVTSNILDTVSSGPVTNAILVCITIGLLLGIAVVLNPICLELEYRCGLARGFSLRSAILRTVCMSFVIFTALSIPHFYSIMSLVGGSSISFLTFVAPPLLYMKLCKTLPRGSDNHFGRLSLYMHERVIHYELIVMGIFVAMLTTWGSITSLADEFGTPCYLDMSQNANEGRR